MKRREEDATDEGIPKKKHAKSGTSQRPIEFQPSGLVPRCRPLLSWQGQPILVHTLSTSLSLKPILLLSPIPSNPDITSYPTTPTAQSARALRAVPVLLLNHRKVPPESDIPTDPSITPGLWSRFHFASSHRTNGLTHSSCRRLSV